VKAFDVVEDIRPRFCPRAVLTLKTYAHSMHDEETDLSFADFSTRAEPKRPYTAPFLSDDPDSENAPDPTGRGRSFYLEHETGLEPATPTLAREDQPQEDQ